MNGKVIASVLNVRSGPAPNSLIIGTLFQNTIVIIDPNKSVSGWYFVYYGNIVGFVSASYIQVVSTTPTTTSSTAKVTGQQIVTFAEKFLGVPYLWGGTTPSGFDCSGFVQYVFKNFGIILPRVSYDQAKVGISVPLNSMQQGDLGFFNPNTQGLGPEHSTIYIGNGLFIHSPHAGSYIRIDRLNGCYIARRVL